MSQQVQVWEDSNGKWHRTKTSADRADRMPDLVALCGQPANQMHTAEAMASWIEDNRQAIANYLGTPLKD